ncbi:hypothetical protein KUTeg_003769 [Tegillarca granosa]|uniref:alpha-L-fucosidase n=1 Tax=Tegillarca granosa TaxID=220873 RepID=A0ABQ9FN26_TEGGR|nr:hypothetical protein KUTeg_003769 [Tegillarca granosa]
MKGCVIFTLLFCIFCTSFVLCTKYEPNWASLDSRPLPSWYDDRKIGIFIHWVLTIGQIFSMHQGLGELANSIRKKTNIHFGEKALPELYELVNKYKPDIVWSDGDWETTDVYWNATQFLAWLYNESPVKDTVAVNDRWGSNIRCKHGGFLNCNDKYNPGVLQKRKWENAMTLDKYSWGYRRNARLTDYLTMNDLLDTLAKTISCGGNLLVNIGPSSDGTIAPIFEERLRQLGQWLGVNGEAIYGSKPWSHQNDTITPNVWYTMQKATNAVYAIVLDWPKGNILSLGAPVYSSKTVVMMLGYQGNIPAKPGSKGGITLNIAPVPADKIPCKWAWVFKFVGLKN